MVAYSFKQRFVAPILAGTKRQTIRAHRKRHAWPEEEMQIYTGMRTKQCRLIARVICEGVAPITIDLPGNAVTLGGETLRGWDKLDPLAWRDGFDGWLSMRCFWLENHPDTPIFSGVLIRWAP
jgi:hypothetical protein